MSHDGGPGIDGSAGFDQQRFLRDLTSLFALPAFWSGQEPAFVLRTLFEALESVLPVTVGYGVADVRIGERLQILRAGGRPLETVEEPWTEVAVLADVAPMGEHVRTVEIRGQPLQCVRLPIGYVGEVGRLVVGSPQAAFPDPAQLMLLRIAVSLTGAGLETARLIRERDDAQRAKDEFLAILGHELRNPLAPIVTALQLMTMKNDGTRTRELDIIERQVQHLRRLVDDLLDVSRITRGTIELRPERVDIAEVVARAVETVSPLMEQRQHDVEVRVPRGLTVDADPTRLTQVVANLLSNAAKYTPRGGRVSVSAERDQAWVVVRVADTGVGLSEDFLPRVFDLFVQGRQDLARTEGGLGIGLALVRQLVRAHGGTVAVRSGGLGRGSEFTVRLPAAAPEAIRTDDAPTVLPVDWRHAASTSARVLIVDDNVDAAKLAAEVLTAAGHRVEIAHSGLQAIQRASHVAFDVLLLDIGLPDLDGYALARELRMRAVRSSGARLIAMTGYGQRHDRERSARAGFAEHLVKPVDSGRLAEAVRQVFLDTSSARSENSPPGDLSAAP